MNYVERLFWSIAYIEHTNYITSSNTYGFTNRNGLGNTPSRLFPVRFVMSREWKHIHRKFDSDRNKYS